MNLTKVDEFLDSLIGTGAWQAQFGQIGKWATAGETEPLLAVAAALLDPSRVPALDEVMRRSVLESIERTLALTPGLVRAEAAMRVSAMRQAQEEAAGLEYAARRHPSKRAARLAQSQPPRAMTNLFLRHAEEAGSREMLTCLAQEISVRAPVRETVWEAVEAFWNRHVRASGHPLAGLPLALLPVERMIPRCLPRFHPEAESGAEAGWPAVVVEPLPVPVALPVNWTETTLSETEAARLRAAVANWEDESNGLLDARVFRADTFLPPGAVTPALARSLPMECLAGVPETHLTLTPISGADAFAALFSAACNGGAYNSGRGGAYGRFAAWRSFGGLAGAAEGEGIEAIAALADRCHWFSFFAASGWFYDVAWDLGLLALYPDGQTLAALAATDTD